MCGGEQGVFLWPGETLIPDMLHGVARKNTHAPPKPRAPWRQIGGRAAYGEVGTVGRGVVESALSRT